MKWVDMLRDWEVLSKTRSGKDLIMKRVRKGVPDNVRGKVWSLLGGVPGLIKENPPVGAEGGSRYAEILAKSKTFVPNQDIRDTIERDINRTFPQHALFKDGGQGQDSLRNVLVRYEERDGRGGGRQGTLRLAPLRLAPLRLAPLRRRRCHERRRCHHPTLPLPFSNLTQRITASQLLSLRRGGGLLPRDWVPSGHVPDVYAGGGGLLAPGWGDE